MPRRSLCAVSFTPKKAEAQVLKHKSLLDSHFICLWGRVQIARLHTEVL